MHASLIQTLKNGITLLKAKRTMLNYQGIPAPWAAFTAANRCGMVNKILSIWFWSKCSHSFNNASSNSFSVLGGGSRLLTAHFSIRQTFSIGFKSGEQDGQVLGPKPSQPYSFNCLLLASAIPICGGAPSSITMICPHSSIASCQKSNNSLSIISVI